MKQALPAPAQIDYRLPFKIRTIFKSAPGGRPNDENYDPVLAQLQGEDNTPKEYASLLAVEWESIAGMQDYPYQDENIWTKFSKSPKFYLILHHQGPHLVEGDFEYWFQCWSCFKQTMNK